MTLDLDFSGKNTRYATHGLHSYAAKCPPQLVKFGIEHYTQPGDLLLDPMMGSGTSLVEANIQGRNAIGFDIDPLACLISRVKSTYIDDEKISSTYSALICKVKSDAAILLKDKNNVLLQERIKPPSFPNRDYWFSNHVQQALLLLIFHIENLPMENELREFFWVAFSGIILSKVSVANARDIIHSRHHYFKHVEEPSVFDKFEKRVMKMRGQIKEFGELRKHLPVSAKVEIGDARFLPTQSATVDFVFTSPPYATALDYPRAHFLAVSWMKSVLDVDNQSYKEKGQTYIGSERGKIRNIHSSSELGQIAQDVITQLRGTDYRKAHLIERYFHDMSKAIGEMNRVLKPGKYAIIVVCPSHIRKIDVPTHEVFTEIALSRGMRLISEHTRTIDSSKRVLPYVRGAFGNRMSTEYVLVYQKGDGRNGE